MEDKNNIFQPAYGSWEEAAKLGGLKSVIDPNDINGFKNRYIDCIHKTVINSAVAFNKDMVVLDFGCGIGRMTKHFSKFVNKIIGVDVTPGMIDVAKEKNSAENIEYHVIDGIHIPLNNDSINLIITVWTLQYSIKNRIVFNQIMQEFQRVLKKDGRICLIEQINQSGSLKEPVKKKDYLNGVGEHFKIEKNYPVRLGGTRIFAQRFIFSKYLSKVLFPLLAYWEVITKKKITDEDLSDYPYVDYLFYGSVKK